MADADRFIGYRGPDGEWHTGYLERNSAAVHPLPHHMKHSPDGHSWGYGGSGPTELARDILWTALFDDEPPQAVVRAFVGDFVQHWRQSGDWVLTASAIRRWWAGLAMEILKDGDAWDG